MTDLGPIERGGDGRQRTLRTEWDRPRLDRFDPADTTYAACMAAHQRAVQASQPGYIDPATGLFVMTAHYLKDRGWCCDTGCRHCPYQPTR